MKPTRSCEIYIDGASHGNPGPAGVGVVVMEGASVPVRQFAHYIGETTNNVAEYLGLLYALQVASQAGYTSVAIKTDSELLARQIAGRYKVRDPHLRVLHDLALHALRGFSRSAVEHIPREQNTLADRLAGQAVRERRSGISTGALS